MKGLRKLFCILLMCTVSLFSASGIYAAAYDTETAEILVECTAMKYFKDYEYKIVIEPQSENAPMPEENEITVLNGETGMFHIDTDEPGTFTYKVFEEKGSNKNINYDRRSYYVTLFVTDYGAEKLIYSVTVNRADDDNKSSRITFRDTERFVLESFEEKSPKPSEPEETSTPEETSVPQTSETVFTGDSSNTGIAAAAMAVSFITAVTTVISVRHRKRDDY